MLLEALLDKKALGQCAANAAETVGQDDATDHLIENADNVLLEAHTDSRLDSDSAFSIVSHQHCT